SKSRPRLSKNLRARTPGDSFKSDEDFAASAKNKWCDCSAGVPWPSPISSLNFSIPTCYAPRSRPAGSSAHLWARGPLVQPRFCSSAQQPILIQSEIQRCPVAAWVRSRRQWLQLRNKREPKFAPKQKSRAFSSKMDASLVWPSQAAKNFQRKLSFQAQTRAAHFWSCST